MPARPEISAFDSYRRQRAISLIFAVAASSQQQYYYYRPSPEGEIPPLFRAASAKAPAIRRRASFTFAPPLPAALPSRAAITPPPFMSIKSELELLLMP